MRVLAYPARRNRDRNPFNYLLSEALVAEGCEVVELDRRNSLFGRWDVFHLHWPQQAAQGNLVRALGNSFVLVARLVLQRVRSARIVWTVHNVRGHDQDNPALERALMRAVTRLIHGAIFLTASSRAPAIEAFPALAPKPYAVVPHGLYGERSERTRGEARATFGLSPAGPVIGFLGDIRRYKGLDRLLSAFAETRPAQLTLFVGGAFDDERYGTGVRARLAELHARDHSIVFHERRLDGRALADAIRACDVVALPYRAIWNSGLALLVLENGGRILASDAPVFRELRDELGSERVRIAAGELTGEDLVAAVCGETREACEEPAAFLAARAWPRIGADTVAFYRRLGARQRS